MVLRRDLVLGTAAAFGILLALACGSDTTSSTVGPVSGGAAGNAGDASAGHGGTGGKATGGTAGAAGSGAGGAAIGGSAGSATGGTAGTSMGGYGGTAAGGSGGLPANPTAQDWGVQLTALAAPFAIVTPKNPSSACGVGGPVAGTTDFNFWVPDGPPRAWVDANNWTHLLVPHMLTYQFKGPSLDSVALDCTSHVSISDFDANPANNNDASWPWSPYLLNGKLYTVFHHEYHGEAHGNCTVTNSEYNPQNCWHPSLTLGVAQDGSNPNTAGGIHRTVPGHVIAQWNTTTAVGGGGFSDPTNIMLNPADGKYYMMALVRGTLLPDGKTNNLLRNCVLRTADLTSPSSWETWNGSAFVGGLAGGATCEDVTGQTAYDSSAPGSLVYSTYFNRVLYLTFAVRADGRHGFFVRAALNNDLTQWSAQTIMLGVQLPWGASEPMRPNNPYPSFLDPNGGSVNFDRIGQNPYLYWVRTYTGDQLQLNREIWRVPVQFYAGAPERDNRVQGFFSVNKNQGYYSNGQGSYCAIVSMQQYNLCNPSLPFNALPDFIDQGADAAQSPDPICACGHVPNPVGCFSVGATGYFANGQGASCPLLDCQMPRICGTSSFPSLPVYANTGTDQVNPACHNPQGCYRVADAGWYSNGQGQSCPLLDTQLQAICGTSDFYALPVGCQGGDQLAPACSTP